MTIKINNYFTIIIPSKKYDKNLSNCITYIRKYYKKTELFILLDEKTSKKFDKNTSIFYFKNKNIGFKRNFAAKKSSKEYLVFIDSDAYPKKGWLENFLNILLKKKKLSAIGGPNLSPPTKNSEKKIISKIRKLPFVTLNNFIKSKSLSRFTDFLPSCNLCVKRKDYLNVGGMDNKILAGEEIRLFYYLNKNKKKIYFSQNSPVYNIDRNLINFLRQRMTYGTEANLFLKYPNKQTFLFLLSILPIFNFLFVILSIPFYETFFFKINTICLFLTFVISIFYAIKISHLNEFFKYLKAILMSIYGPGIGFILQFFSKESDQKRRYRQV